MLISALNGAPDAVVSGSVMGWGSAIEDCFDAVAFLYVETSIRVARLIEREQRLHGSARPEFLEWAASYDGNPAEGRSLAAHRNWLGSRRCKVVELVGPQNNEERLKQFLSTVALKERA